MKPTPKQIAALVRVFQAKYNADVQSTGLVRNPLEVDGKLGPSTSSILSGWYSKNLPPGCTEYYSDPEPEPASDLAERFKKAYWFAYSQIGKGGDGIENNEGAFIQQMRDDLDLPCYGYGEWCALFVSWCLQQTGTPSVKHRGAKALYELLLTKLNTKAITDADSIPSGSYGVALFKTTRGYHITFFYKSIHSSRYCRIGGNEGVSDEVKFSEKLPTEFKKNLVGVVVAQ